MDHTFTFQGVDEGTAVFEKKLSSDHASLIISEDEWLRMGAPSVITVRY